MDHKPDRTRVSSCVYLPQGWLPQNIGGEHNGNESTRSLNNLDSGARDEEIKALSDDYVEVPCGIPEILSPIPFIIPLQLLAYYMAIGRATIQTCLEI